MHVSCSRYTIQSMSHGRALVGVFQQCSHKQIPRIPPITEIYQEGVMIRVIVLFGWMEHDFHAIQLEILLIVQKGSDPLLAYGSC